MVACDIDINDAEDGVYTPGQSISGSLRLTLDKPTEIEYIKTSLEGISICVFLARGKRNRTEEPIITDHVMQEIHKNTEPGEYKYPFNFTLPDEVPSTFNETLGYIDRARISYTIKVDVKINKEKKCVQSEKEFFVQGNIVPRTLTNGSNQTYLMRKSLMSFDEQEIIMMTHISATYVQPGGVLRMLFQIMNHSDIDITGTRIEFLRTVSMLEGEGGSLTTTHTKTFKEHTVQKQSIYANHDATVFHLLRIPEGINTINSLELLSVEYKVKVTMVLPFPHSNESIIIPIPVGEPKADVPGEEPKADVPGEELNADVPMGEPKADVPVEEPKTDVPVGEPKAGVPVGEPMAVDIPVGEPDNAAK